MKPLEDPQVVDLASQLSANAMVPWPAHVTVPVQVCAMVQVLNGDNISVALNPDHDCPQQDRLILKAAAVALDYIEAGPDEGWNATAGGHVTFLTDSFTAALGAPGMVIPESERGR